MAARTAKERPYHCQLCNRRLATDELGFVCEHVAHGTMVTLVADPPSKSQPIPDTACTACDGAMASTEEGAEDAANIHVVCEPCYRAARGRNIDSFTPADRKQGYVLVPRAHYDRVWKRAKPLAIGPIREGRVLKLGFSPIPSTYPVALERMWVRVTCVLPGGEIHGVLANDPALFRETTLKADDAVVFAEKHVLEIEAGELKAAKKKAAKKKAAKKKAAKKRAAKTTTTMKSRRR